MKNRNESSGASLLCIIEGIADRVSDAIGGYDAASLPIITFVLDNYVTALKTLPEFDADFYEYLKESLRPVAYEFDPCDPKAEADLKDFKDSIKEANQKKGW